MINFDTYFHIEAWEQERSPVGRVALIPTFIYITNNLCRSIKTLYANIFCFYQLFTCANLRRHQGKPTYCVQSLLARFYFMSILICGAMAIASYGVFNRKLFSSKNYKIPQHRTQP